MPLPAPGLDPFIHQAIAGADVETANPVGIGPGQHRDVGNAADVDDAPGLVGGREHPVMERGNQRRALAAERDVCATEVGDGRDARRRGDERWIAELDRRSRAIGIVEHGLPMRAGGVNLDGGHTRAPQQAGSRAREGLRHRVIEPSQAVEGQCGARALQTEERVAQSRRIPRGMRRDDTPESVVVEFAQRGVDAVHAGSGHQAEVQLRHTRLRRRISSPVRPANG
jgi:hypothetical protein